MERFTTWYLGRMPRLNPSGPPFSVGFFIRRGFLVVPVVSVFWLCLDRAGFPGMAILAAGVLLLLPPALALARRTPDRGLAWDSLRGLGVLVLSTLAYFHVGGVLWLLLGLVVWVTAGLVTEVWWIP